jgi:hypothetical protein
MTVRHTKTWRTTVSQRLIVLGAMVFLVFAHGSAQERSSSHGVLTGSMRDRLTGSPIFGGNITIVGSTLGGVTDDQGKFRITNIPSGTYLIRASVIGYESMVFRNVSIRAADSVVLDIALNEQSIEVGEVVVSSDRFREQDIVPQILHHEEYKEIHNTAGAFDDVARAIAILPGMAHNQPERNHLYVRGGSSTENLFFVDQLEVPNINHFGAQGSSGGTMSFVNFEFIESVTFSNGGFGAAYGDKLSSVLNLGIRTGRTDRLRGKLTLSATMLGLNMEGPLGEGNSYLFSVRRSYLDPVFKFYGFSYIPVFWDFLGKVHYSLDKYNTIDVLGVGAIDKMVERTVTLQNKYDNERLIFSDQNVAVGGITWKHGFDQGLFSLTARKYYADFFYRQYRNSKNFFRNISYEDENSLRADATILLSNSMELSAGGEFKYVILDSRTIATVIVTGYSDYPVTIPVDTTDHETAQKGAAYVQLTKNIGPMKIALGLRGDHFSLIRNGTVAGPRLSVSYTLSEVTKLSMSVGRYYQSPSYVWLMTNPYNRSLNHLAMNQYMIGIEHFLSGDLKFSIEGYVKQYEQYPGSFARPYIVMINSGSDVTDLAEAYTAFGLDYLGSIGHGYSRGIDIFTEKRLSEIPLYGRVSLSLSETRFTAYDGVSRPSNNDQKIILNAGAGYLFDERWETTATFRYSSGRPYAPVGVGARFFERSSAYYNTARTEENHCLDLRISRRWEGETVQLVTYLDIQNVYNRKWRGVPFYSDVNKRIELPLSTGIVPSVGMTAEF